MKRLIQQTQWSVNKGKCGICGDPWNGRRDNEYPNGKYTKPLYITASQPVGSVLDTLIEVTTAHLGYFVFKLCPALSRKREVTQECLDKHVLKVITVAGNSDRYDFGSSPAGKYHVYLRLPQNVVCRRCVLQFTYITGNTWGKCDNESYGAGCGPQETFRGCADINIYQKTTIGRPN